MENYQNLCLSQELVEWQRKLVYFSNDLLFLWDLFDPLDQLPIPAISLIKKKKTSEYGKNGKFPFKIPYQNKANETSALLEVFLQYYGMLLFAATQVVEKELQIQFSLPHCATYKSSSFMTQVSNIIMDRRTIIVSITLKTIRTTFFILTSKWRYWRYRMQREIKECSFTTWY